MESSIFFPFSAAPVTAPSSAEEEFLANLFKILEIINVTIISLKNFLVFVRVETIKEIYGYSHKYKLNSNFTTQISELDDLKKQFEGRWKADVKALKSNSE